MALVLRKFSPYWLWLFGGFAGLLLEVSVLGSDSGIGLSLGIIAGALAGWSFA
jgi:hypothetical protein